MIPLHQLGALGIIKDTPFHELPPNAWTEGQNVRFVDGAVEATLGRTTLLLPPVIEPRHIQSVVPTDGNTARLVYLSNTKARTWDGVTETDITRAAGDYTASDTVLWNSTFLSGVPIFTNLNDIPQYWGPQNTATRLQNLPAFPATLRLKVVRAFKGFLVGLHAIKSGTELRHMVKWSDAADPGTVPATWNEADPTNLAGEQDLADSPGIMMDCAPLGDINVVYKEDAVWSMAFVGGTFIFQFRKMFTDFGLLATNAVVEFERKHCLLSQDNLIVHDGSQFTKLLTRAWQRELFGQIDFDYKQRVFLFANRPKQEVWVCFPTIGGTGWPTKALVWNWKDGQFGFQDLPPASGIVLSSFAPTTDTFDGGSVGTIDTDLGVFNTVNFTNQRPVIASPEPDALYQGESTNTFSGVVKTSTVERVGLAIDGGRTREGEPRVDLTTIKMIRGVYPKFECAEPSKLKFYVGSQMFVDGPVTWFGPFTTDQQTGFKFDCTISARLLALRVQSTEDVFWRLWGMDVDIEIIGAF